MRNQERTIQRHIQDKVGYKIQNNCKQAESAIHEAKQISSRDVPKNLGIQVLAKYKQFFFHISNRRVTSS